MSIRSMQQRTASPIASPVLILAPPGSLGSHLCQMLGRHPSLFGCPQLNLFVEADVGALLAYATPPRDIYLHGLLRMIAEVYIGEQSLQAVRAARRWLTRRREMSTGALYRELAERLAPRRLVEYSATYFHSETIFQRVVDAFAEVRLVHLTRHPIPQGEAVVDDIAQSTAAYLKGFRHHATDKPSLDIDYMMENYFDYSATPTLVDPQYAWYRAQRRIEAEMRALGTERHECLRAEDLMSQPAAELGRLCHWLGLECSTETLEAMQHPEQSPFARFGPFQAQLGLEREFLRTPWLRQLPPPPPSALSAPLPWRPDRQGLVPEIRALAADLGYGDPARDGAAPPAELEPAPDVLGSDVWAPDV